MNISVVYVVANLDVGGAERHIAQIVPRLDRSLIKPSVFTIINKGVLSAEIEAFGIPIVGPKKECEWQQLNKFHRIISLGRSAVRLFFLLRREPPDVIHFFLPMPYIVGGLIAMLAGVKVCVMSRRSLNHYQTGYLGAARLERWLHKRMSFILGNSKAVLQDLRKEGVSEQQLGLIYNGVDIPAPQSSEMRAELRQQVNVSRTDLLITIVANLIPYKGHEDLLQGIASVVSAIPSNWKLICVGRDSHGIKNQLIALTKELGISNNVEFLGGRDDVSSILQASDIAVLSSHQEGFSNAVLEGMAAELPSVVTNVGGNAEAVRDGVDGFVVSAHDPEGLGEAIKKLLNDEKLRIKMGAAAFERVKNKFSVQSCVHNYEKMYHDILRK